MDEDSQLVLVIIFGSFILTIIVSVFVWYQRRSKFILLKWSNENGFEITQKKKHFLFSGPFKWWTNSRNQTIYSVTVRDRNGHERSGWVRCGSFLGGVFFSDKIEVVWDDP